MSEPDGESTRTSAADAATGRAESPAPRHVARLPEALIDQIAAGEVVERPASVVKELVENALDAGAGRVRVEVRSGGRDWIAVTDDGSGMTPGDAELALERHATSKLGSAADLDRIATYGFRGEALPAIASVSRLRLRTRTRDAEHAVEIQVDAGRRSPAREAAGPPGTRIEVADLFSNVPARRKFLKTVTTEWGHISDWLARSALALPGVHFDVRRDDRPAIHWPATDDPLDRVAAVVSEEDAAAFVPVDSTGGRGDGEGRAVLRGFVSRPDRHRSTMAGIYLYVNQRPVRDRVLQHALVQVYRDVLPRGRFPSAVLFLELPPESVDVNVHPAKWEVRFAEPQAIHELMRHSVRAALEQRQWVGGGGPGASGAPRVTGASVSGPRDWIFAPNPPGAPAPGGPAGATGATGAAYPAEDRHEFGDPSPAFAFDASAPADRLRFADLPLLGQLLATYLVLEAKEGLLLIDQHAAHERVLYEQLRAEWVERGVERQALLVPATLQLAPHLAAALLEHADALARLGFELEPFGDDTVAVRAIPALLTGVDPIGLVRELADEVASRSADGDIANPAARVLDAADRIFASLACHSARRKGEVMGEAEQRSLLDAVDAIPWAPTCPHGRPVAVPLDLAEIERRFARR